MVNQQEAKQIARIIIPIFQNVLDEYDFGKYPAAPYECFKASFSNLNPTDNDIESAMIWKWGHWGKSNFPQNHHNLIHEIQSIWPQFRTSDLPHESLGTFQWWKNRLNRNTIYISVAYITHLIHNQEPLPIIDQHNFRAMNHLIRVVRPRFVFKEKPSQWQDIQNLKSFMQSMRTAIPGLSFPAFDKFLMMYGRNHLPR